MIGGEGEAIETLEGEVENVEKEREREKGEGIFFDGGGNRENWGEGF